MEQPAPQIDLPPAKQVFNKHMLPTATTTTTTAIVLPWSNDQYFRKSIVMLKLSKYLRKYFLNFSIMIDFRKHWSFDRSNTKQPPPPPLCSLLVALLFQHWPPITLLVLGLNIIIIYYHNQKCSTRMWQPMLLEQSNLTPLLKSTGPRVMALLAVILLSWALKRSLVVIYVTLYLC